MIGNFLVQFLALVAMTAALLFFASTEEPIYEQGAPTEVAQ